MLNKQICEGNIELYAIGSVAICSLSSRNEAAALSKKS